MAASTNILNLEEPMPAEDWTVVLPRRGKQKRKFSKTIVPKAHKEVQAWVPRDLGWDLERETKLMQKIHSYIQRLEKSQFYEAFVDQMQAPEIAEQFLRVRGSEEKLQMVIYGIGSIESFESPRWQLSMVILMKRRFSWIGDIEVFDPIISFTESKVLEAFGCTVLSIDEQCQRRVLGPTLFFMPHCDVELYDNLVRANWRSDLLNQIVVFGNSFSEYEQLRSFCRNPTLLDTKKHVHAIQRYKKEYAISIKSGVLYRAFNGSSWHFFCIDSEAALQIV